MVDDAPTVRRVARAAEHDALVAGSGTLVMGKPMQKHVKIQESMEDQGKQGEVSRREGREIK